MLSRRKSPPKHRSLKLAKDFDPQAFLTSAGVGKAVFHYKPKQAVFSQGEHADTIFYIQSGTVQLSVLSKQGKEATLALLGPGDFIGEGMSRRRSTHPPRNRHRHCRVLNPAHRKETNAQGPPRAARTL
jgi:CRP-like cAMP-binding protein